MNERTPFEQDLIDRLLRFDLEVLAKRMGYIENISKGLSDNDAVTVLNYAERLSRRALDDDDRNLCLTLCGLVWEHRRPEWHALSPFLVQILSRLGLGPSTKMVDVNYDPETRRYGSLGSLMAEMQVTALQVESEVRLGRTILLLSRFQKILWDAIDVYPRLGVSAPTSAGKSFLLVSKIADLLLSGATTIVYVVPTLSLIQQVSRDLRVTFRAHSLTDVEVSQSVPPVERVSKNRVVYVLTQERLQAALLHPQSLGRVDLFVVDEIQNIERVAEKEEERAQILYQAIQDFQNDLKPARIIISGPRISDIGALAKTILGSDARSVSEDLPPVVSLTYTFRKRGRHIYMRQYSIANPDPQELSLPDDVPINPRIFGQSRYRDPAFAFIRDVVQHVEHDGGTLVFSPTTDQANNTAESLAELSREVPQELLELAQYARDSVHPSFALATRLEGGVAYHHSKMPMHMRNAVEHAFSQGYLKVLTCTTTLMQGVNLPAKTIIARNPDLFIRKIPESVRLTNYEFANLRGRAGRLMKDFVGRAIVLDEEAFEDAQISFDNVEKAVRPGYGERFEAHRTDILAVLTSGSLLTDVTAKYGDLIAFIRHSILRHKEGAPERLQRTGIILTQDEFSSIQVDLQNLTIPSELVAKCPQWDPLALDHIYVNRDIFPSVPHHPLMRDFVITFHFILDRLQELVPYYYQKHFDIYNDGRITSILVTAQNWANEQPLPQVIGWSKTAEELSSDTIDERIDTLNSTVMYDLPKLLRPVVTFQDEENPILSDFEFGANRPETRYLIGLGIPREISVRLVNLTNASRFRGPRGEVLEAQLLDQCRRALARLSRWERVQVEDVLR